MFGFLKGTGQALGMLAPLVVAKLFSSEALFGSYSLAKMVVFFFGALLISSCQTPFVVFANQERAETGRINKAFTVQLAFLVFSLCAFVAIGLLFHDSIAHFAKISSVDVVFMVLAFIGIAFKAFVCNLFMAMGQRLKNALAELVFGGLTVFFIFMFYFAGEITLRTVFLVYLLSAVCLVLIFVWTVDFGRLLPLKLDGKYFRKMFAFTRWVMFGATAVYFINWGDLAVLRHYKSLGVIGSYNLGYQVFKGLTMMTFMINTYFLPFVSQHIDDAAAIRNYLYNKRPKILLLGGAVLGTAFVVVPYIFKAIYGGSYPGAVTVMRILFIGSAMILYVIFYSPIFNALKLYRFIQITSFIQVVLNLVLDVLLVPRMGMYGAAVATVLAYLCKAIMYELYFRIRLKPRIDL